MRSDKGIKPSDLLEISKLKIMLPVSFTGFLGYFLYNPDFTGSLFLVTAGILLMGIAASVLNQFQEKDIDSMMERTRNRPLPSGRIKGSAALVLFAITLVTGAFLVLTYGNKAAMFVSLLTVAWYNGVYTNLKKITAYAVVPGALTGALPPLIGWMAAGGSPFDVRIILVQLLFFIGQLPHFWLLVLRYGSEYENAGLPTLTAIMSPERISRLILGMVGSFTIIAVMMRLYGLITSSAIFVSLLVFSLILFMYFRIFAKFPAREKKAPRYSVLLNLYFISVMILLITDRLIEKL